MSMAIFPEEKLKEEITKRKKQIKETEEWRKKSNTFLGKIFKVEQKYHPSSLYLSTAMAAEKLGILYILANQYDLAREAFKTSANFEILHQKASPPISYFNYGEALALLRPIILSMDEKISSEIQGLNIWQHLPSEIQNHGIRSAELFTESLVALTFANYNKAHKLVSMKEYTERNWSTAGILAVSAILQKNLEQLKEAIQTIINSHISENHPYLKNPDTAISPLATSILILAIKRGIPLGAWDPKYIPIDYIHWAKEKFT